MAICFTADFITPVVDDPHDWGRIAAANSLSDIYAMGAQPLAALNLVCWPDCLSAELLTEVLAGGSQAAAEAGCLVVGGHTGVRDNITLGAGVRVAAFSGVAGDIAPGQTVAGRPAISARDAHRIALAKTRLPELIKRVRSLEARLKALEPSKDNP